MKNEKVRITEKTMHLLGGILKVAVLKKRIATFGLWMLMTGVAPAGVIVYQDDFDNDGLGTNTGIGGGGVNNTIFRANGQVRWQDNGNLSFRDTNRNFNNRAIFYSSNSFQSNDGFQLTVDYTTSSIGSQLQNQFSFGLVSDETDLSAYALSNPFGVTNSVYSIGANVTANGGNRGLNFTDGSSVTALDTSGTNQQFISGSSTPVVINIGTGGAWRYSINGVREASGTIPGGFDLTKSYRFVAYAQDNEYVRSIQSVQLEAVPEPGSLAMFISGAGLLLLRRRRSSGSDSSETKFCGGDC